MSSSSSLSHFYGSFERKAEDEEEEEQCLMREAADEHELTMAEQDEEQQQKNRLVLERRGKVLGALWVVFFLLAIATVLGLARTSADKSLARRGGSDSRTISFQAHTPGLGSSGDGHLQEDQPSHDITYPNQGGPDNKERQEQDQQQRQQQSASLGFMARAHAMPSASSTSSPDAAGPPGGDGSGVVIEPDRLSAEVPPAEPDKKAEAGPSGAANGAPPDSSSSSSSSSKKAAPGGSGAVRLVKGGARSRMRGFVRSSSRGGKDHRKRGAVNKADAGSGR